MNKLTTILGIFVCTGIFLWGAASSTLAAPPTVAITAESGQNATGFTLNGTFNPNSISTTAYFRYWENNPGNCIDAGGFRVPTSGGTVFSDGTSHSFTQTVTGLVPNKTYYYCAIADNGSQKVYHSTTTASYPTSNGATNPCDIPPNTTSGYTVTAGANCSFPLQPVGANVPLGTVGGMDGGSLTIGSGASLLLLANQTIVFQSISKSGAVINKTPGGILRKGYIYVKDQDNDNFYAANSTTYSANSNDGTLTGQGYKRRYLITGSSYITQAVDCDDSNAAKNVPSTCAVAGAATNGVTSIAATTATLNGTANPNGDNGTRAYFKYGTTNTGDCSTLHSTGGASTAATLITGTSSQPFSVGITGLSFGNLYYWCSIVFNNIGTTYSTIGSFVTISAPTSLSSTNVTQTTLDLTWTAPTTGANGYRIYRCNRTSVPGCTPTFLTTDPNNASPYSDSGLTCNTQYAYQVAGTQTAGGTGNEGELSSVYTVTTSSCASAPTVTTSAATSVTGTTAILNSTVNPGNASTSITYRYQTGSTSTCNGSTPTSTIAGPSGLTGGSNLSGGTTQQLLTGLSPTTTYYFCVTATNSQGTTYGTVLNFTTTASAPTVTTSAATSVTGTTAILNSTINPGGASTSITYRYQTGSTSTCNGSTPTSTIAGPSGLTGTSNLSGATTQQTLSGLSGSTTYYFCVTATNSQGTTYGTVLNFTTSSLLPNGSACTTGSECSSGNCYVDGDSDRYAPSSGSKTCRASTQLGATGADCDDTKSTVFTGQTSYFSTAIGSGGPKAGTFDYDCSGGITSNPSPAQYCSSRATSDDFYTTYQTCGSFAVSGYFCTSGPYALSLPSACGKWLASGPYYALSGGCVTSTVVASTTIGCR